MTASHGWTVVSWPDSQRIMGHPQAYQLIAGPQHHASTQSVEWPDYTNWNNSYVVPTEVWCHYQHSYYEDEE